MKPTLAEEKEMHKRRLARCLEIGHLVNAANAGGYGVCCFCRRLLTPKSKLIVVGDDELAQLVADRAEYLGGEP